MSFGTPKKVKMGLKMSKKSKDSKVNIRLKLNLMLFGKNNSFSLCTNSNKALWTLTLVVSKAQKGLLAGK